MKKFLFMLLALLFLGALPASAQLTGPISGVKVQQTYIVNFTATSTVTGGQIVKLDTSNGSQIVPVTLADAAVPIGIMFDATCNAGWKCEVAISGTVDGLLKTENTCAVGNFVSLTSITGGHGGNAMCSATASGPFVGRALSAATGSAAEPLAIDLLVQIGSPGSAAPLSKWTNTAASGTQTTVTLSAANQTRLWGFDIDVPVTFSHLVFNIATADTAAGSLCGAFADCYDVGIYNSSGVLQADCGAAAFSSTGATDCTTVQGSLTLQSGAYYFAFTGTATTAGITYASGNISFASFGLPSAGGTTTNGVLNGSMTPPADSWITSSAKQALFALHN